MTDYINWRDKFAAVLDPAFYTIEWLDSQVVEGKFKVFASDKGAIIAEIQNYPTGAKVVHGLLAVGELQEIVRLIPLAEQWGQSLGAVAGEISSREGWSKALPDYSVYQVTIRKGF